MKNYSWHDAKVDKPKTTDPVLGHTTDGRLVVVQWGVKSRWYELSSDEDYDNVDRWADIHLSHGMNISDDYYTE